MKIRTGFVGNSSSSSFVIVNKSKKRQTVNKFFDELLDSLRDKFIEVSNSEEEIIIHDENLTEDFVWYSIDDFDTDYMTAKFCYCDNYLGIIFGDEYNKRRYIAQKPVFARIDDGEGQLSRIMRRYLMAMEELETPNFYIKVLEKWD